MYKVYKDLFTGEIVRNTEIKTAFKDFKDTSIYERYMLNACQFSAAKSAAEARLMQSAVFDSNGAVKPFGAFKKDAEEIAQVTQKTWLRTEYETARRQAVHGSQFARMQADKDLYPFWIYKGMMDKREREEHVRLENKVFRIGDPVGDRLFPPNGWNCRCTGEPIDAQDMRDQNLKLTDDKEAESLTQSDVDSHFRYNPAIEGILPKTGSYFDVLPSANSANFEVFGLPSSEVMAPTMTVTRLMELAQEAGPQVDQVGQDLAKKFGGKVTPINYKSKGSIERKVASDYGGDYSRVKDSVRNTIVLPQGEIEAAVKEMKADPRFTVKQQFHDKDPLGYSGTIATFRADNGLLAEIQVNSPEMIYAKEAKVDAMRTLGKGVYKTIQKKAGGLEGGKGHKFYEDWRKMKIETDALEMKAIEKKSKDYYSKFLDIANNK